MYDDGVDRRPWRPIDPPRPVVVHMLRAFPRETIGHANRVPLWVDATGADLRTPVNGLLHGWLLTSGGTWWGQVAFTLRSRNGDLNMDVMQLVRSDALTPEGDA